MIYVLGVSVVKKDITFSTHIYYYLFIYLIYILY